LGLQNNPNKNEDKKHAWQLPSKCRGLANKKNPQQICREQCREQLLVNLNKNASPQKKENSKNKFHPEKVDFSSFFFGKTSSLDATSTKGRPGFEATKRQQRHVFIREIRRMCIYYTYIYIYYIRVFCIYFKQYAGL